MSTDRPSFVVAERFGLGDRWITPGVNEIDGVRVDPKAMDVLVALVEAAPIVLSGTELLDRVWPNVVVVHNVVYQAIAQLRKVLGDEAHAPRYIETIPRCGYRIVAQITREVSGEPKSGFETPRRRHNLPIAITSFVGRERELVEIRDLLARHRLITLTGVGGCGKTRLALALASACLSDFVDGAWLVELASVTDRSQIYSSVARALGIRAVAGLEERLLEGLADKQLLLIIDNCEHLIDACAQLVEGLLTHAPGLRIIATSREALNIGGERAWRVQSLAVPDLTPCPPLTKLGEVESVRLFTERASTHGPFTLTQENALAVASICRRLDGIPLAIELAATQMRSMSIEQIAGRLGASFRLLTGGSRTALPRQRTLKATLDWSHNLLSEAQRVLLRRLSVFSGGFTLEAAESITTGDPLQKAEIVDHLSGLVDQSMVHANPCVGADARYHLLETVRQYAQDRLLESLEGDAVRNRHRDYFVAVASKLSDEMVGQSSGDWFAWFLAEQGNVNLAFEWCLDSDAEAGLSLAANLAPLWLLSGLFNELHWLEEFLSKTHQLTISRVKALHFACLMALWRGELAKAKHHSEHAVILAKNLEAHGYEAAASAGLAAVMMAMGQRVEARCEHARALEIARNLGDRRLLGECLLLVALGSVSDGFDRVQPLVAESAELLRSVGDRWNLLDALVFWAQEQTYVKGEFERARSLLEEALGLARGLGNPRRISDITLFLGLLAEAQGDYQRAAALMQESLSVNAGIDPENCHVRISLGRVLCRLDDYERGLKMLQDGFEWARKGQTQRHAMFSAIALYGLSFAASEKHQYVRGARLYGAALQIRRDAPPSWMRDLADPAENALIRVTLNGTLPAIRMALGEYRFDALVAEGAAMTVDQVLALALTDEPAADTSKVFWEIP